MTAIARRLVGETRMRDARASVAVAVLACFMLSLRELPRVSSTEGPAEEDAPKGLYISEIMAANASGLADEDGDRPGWIELHNASDAAVELQGHSLSVDPEKKTLWALPEVSIPADGYLVIFASGKDRPKGSGPPHAKFKLAVEKGYVGLIGPDGAKAVAEIGPQYPAQEKDISYGIDRATGGTRRFFATPSPGKRNARSEVVINEVHYDPGSKTKRVEFVELFNPGSVDVDLSGAKFDKGIDFTFADGTILAARSFVVVAQDPVQFASYFGGAALGPWAGGLSNSGEKLTLLNRAGGALDKVDYKAGYPWPTVGMTPGRSIQLVNADLDNDEGSNWRSAKPTGIRAMKETVLIEAKSEWKYRKGTSEASNPRALWRRVDFDERGWEEGSAPLGYDTQSGLRLGTNLPDMRSRYRCLFLRKSFDVQDPSKLEGIQFEAMFDDGINIWINGHHVLTQNLSGPEVSYASSAQSSIENDQFRVFTLSLPKGVLTAGRNVLAVQLHNSGSSSTDAFFDCRLVSRQSVVGGNNAVFAANSASEVRKVKHAPQQPTSNQPVTISAKVGDVDGVKEVALLYQVVEPGQYLPRTDPAFARQWSAMRMADDGANGDELAGDGIYTAVVPAGLQQHRRLVRYRVQVTDGRGETIAMPFIDDLQPNFAYFVYDGVPAWRGAARPRADRPVTYPAELMNELPVYSLIARKKDVEDAMWHRRYNGSDYLWTGTFVYDGVVYDHIGFRSRGGMWRHSFGKNMWKIKFHNGHEMVAKDQDGKPYKEKWDTLNLGACIQHGNYGRRGEHGLLEAVTFRLFAMAGVPSPNTHYIHFRVIDEPAEADVDQYSGDLWGLYLAVEQPDGSLLKEHGLPDGNLYKMENGKGPGNGELQNVGQGQPTDHSDLLAFVNMYERDPPEEWWRKTFDLDQYYRYRSIIEAVHHYDIGQGKNYLYLNNPMSGKWQVLPWDVDLTWGDHVFGDGHEPMRDRVLTIPAFYYEYQNRMREIRDLLYNEEQTGQLIDEIASRIYMPGKPSWVDVDRAMWDYHPAMWDSSYTPIEHNKAGQGRYYQMGRGRGFAGMIELMKSYVRTRAQWMDQNFLNDGMGPRKPVAVREPQGAGGELRFKCGPFGSRSGRFAAMKWRIARVNSPAVGVQRGVQRYYEIDAAWESEELKEFREEVTIPASAVEVGGTYRVRVKMKDTSGRWSHWSEPIEFVAGGQGRE